MITEDHLKELDQLIAAGVDADDILSEWEQGFISEWADKLETYQTNLRVSDKQQAIFDRLRVKLEKEGRL